VVSATVLPRPFISVSRPEPLPFLSSSSSIILTRLGGLRPESTTFLYCCVFVLCLCVMCHLSVVLLYYCHRAEAQLQFNIYIYIYIYIYFSENLVYRYNWICHRSAINRVINAGRSVHTQKLLITRCPPSSVLLPLRLASSFSRARTDKRL
jgi:hypothetical protein